MMGLFIFSLACKAPLTGWRAHVAGLIASTLCIAIVVIIFVFSAPDYTTYYIVQGVIIAPTTIYLLFKMPNAANQGSNAVICALSLFCEPGIIFLSLSADGNK